MIYLVLALGLVLALEGLALALAPSRILEVLAALAALPRDRRRFIGLCCMALGVLLIWISVDFSG
jgi:uncharacterized protein YjeT (DUF2065 family)